MASFAAGYFGAIWILCGSKPLQPCAGHRGLENDICPLEIMKARWQPGLRSDGAWALKYRAKPLLARLSVC